MGTTVEDLREQLRSTLEGDAAARSRTLADLLAEHAQIEGWEALALNPELRATLGRRREEVSAAVAALLAAWRRVGGEVVLVLPSSASPPPVEAEPAAPTPPAKPAPAVVPSPAKPAPLASPAAS